MASDYGDESGEKMLDNFHRYAERMGEQAMRERALKLQAAFENARDGADAGGAEPPAKAAAEFAKLDMHEFSEIDGYQDVKRIIEAKLAAKGVDSTWFSDLESGREYLLFHVADVREVWEGFDELAKETDAAVERCVEKLRESERENDRGLPEEKGLPRDERTLDERARQAREASEALEAERSGGRSRDKGPRFQETRSK